MAPLFSRLFGKAFIECSIKHQYMNTFSFFEKILVCLFLTIVLGVLLYFLFYVIPSKPGDFSALTYIWMFIGYGLIYVSFLILLLRLIRVLKTNNFLFYVFLGVANISMWALCIVLFYLGKVNLWWLNRCLLNLLLGVLIISDGVLFPHRNEILK
jgi:hypothetical protein